MIRAFLCGGLSALTLLLGILTALVQSQNREKALYLNSLKEDCSMLEAINGDRAEQILAKDYGSLSLTGRALEDAPKPAHVPPVSTISSRKVATP